MTLQVGVDQVHVIKVTVRIEVPVVFPLPADADERGVTWDDLIAMAVERVTDAITPAFARTASEIVALRGPGSSGHYSEPSSLEILAAPHLSADFPEAVQE
jgi:hypothetical protein